MLSLSAPRCSIVTFGIQAPQDPAFEPPSLYGILPSKPSAFGKTTYLGATDSKPEPAKKNDQGSLEYQYALEPHGPLFRLVMVWWLEELEDH